MALSLVEAPIEEPLSLEAAKAQLDVEVADDDALIAGLIVAAREHVETFTRRALVTQTWALRLDCFQAADYYQDGALWLPYPPVQEIASITYVDGAGVTQTWDEALYELDAPAGPKARRARLAPAYSESWPTVRAGLNSVVIQFVAGYGDPDDVPASVRQAMKILVTVWYENRGAGEVTVPTAVDALLWPFKAF